MIKIYVDCPHCCNGTLAGSEKIAVGIFQRFLRSSKWIKCPSCGESSIFDYYTKINFPLTCVFWILWTAVLFFSVIIYNTLFIESVVIFTILFMALISYMHFSTLKLRKIGRRKEDQTPMIYETKMQLISVGTALLLMLWGFLVTYFIESTFGLVALELQTLNSKKKVANEQLFENSFLLEKEFQKQMDWYVNREGQWSKKCKEGIGYYCRLLSRISYFRNDVVGERNFLSKSCDLGDKLGCYRLFSLENTFDEKGFLIESCLNSENKQDAYCINLAKDLRESGDVENALAIYKNECTNHKRYCTEFTKFFPTKNHKEDHDYLCRHGIKSSCDAILFMDLSSGSREMASDLAGKLEDTLISAVTLGNKTIVEKLISKGASVQSEDEQWNTPLHLAVQSADFNMVEFLLSKGAKVNTVNMYGETPLMMAVNLPKEKNKKMVKILLDRRAELNFVNSFSQTALTLASQKRNTDVLETLLFEDANLYLHQRTIPQLNNLRQIIRFGHPNSTREIFARQDTARLFNKVEPIKLVYDALAYSSLETLNILLDIMQKDGGISFKEYSDNLLEIAYFRGDKDLIKTLKSRDIASSPSSLLTALRISFYRYVHFRRNQ